MVNAATDIVPAAVRITLAEDDGLAECAIAAFTVEIQLVSAYYFAWLLQYVLLQK
jgi:hypothetical protein